jgi:hypothetical protein
MARALSTPLQQARLLLASSAAWLLFAEIPTYTGGYFRVVRNTRNLFAGGVLWQAAELEIELPDEDAEGTLGSMRVSVPNVSRIPMAYLELGSVGGPGYEFLGQTVDVWLTTEDNLATLPEALRWSHLIVAGEATEETFTLECGHAAAGLVVPGRRMTRRQFPQLLPSGGAAPVIV